MKSCHNHKILMVKKIISMVPVFTFITFGLNSCKPPVIPILSQSFEQTLRKGLEHLNEMNQEAETERFISIIDHTNDIVEFKESGEVYLHLRTNNQVFNITRLQQQHRLCGLKTFLQTAK